MSDVTVVPGTPNTVAVTPRPVNTVVVSEQRGLQGVPGPGTEYRVTATHIQWKLAPLSEEAWQNLIALEELKGPPGAPGVAAAHAATHATGGDDEVTPAAIGAATPAQVTAAVAAEATARDVAIGLAVTAGLNALLDGAPSALDTLNELAAAVNDDASFAAAMTAALATKIAEGDPRLTNARTPTAHAASHGEGGADALTLAMAQVTGLVAALATKIAEGDARLTNARTPTAHAASHAEGQSDALTLTQAQVTGLVVALAGKAVARGAWVTATAYAVNDLVASSSTLYRCLVAHVSGTFATDLAAAKWEVLLAGGGGSTTIPADVLRAGFGNNFVFPATTRPATPINAMGVSGPYQIDETSPDSQNYGVPYNSLYFALNVTAVGTITATLAGGAGNKAARIYNSAGAALGVSASPFTANIPAVGTYFLELINVDPHTPTTVATLTLSGSATLGAFNAEPPYLEPIAPAFTPLTSATTINLACNGAKASNRTLVLEHNATLNITGASSGIDGELLIDQGAVAGNTLTWPTLAAAPVIIGALNTVAGKRTWCTWTNDGAKYIVHYKPEA